MLIQNYATTIGNYSIDANSCIGEGFSAKVHLGMDVRTGQKVAIKAINRASISSQVEMELLRNEMQCYSFLNHGNIVKIYDQLESPTHIYIVSEYCQRGSLLDLIQKNGRISEDIAINFLSQIAAATQYAHSRGVLHRDIKSANILVKGDYQLKLADFGFADFVNRYSTASRVNVGSPLYMSPESLTSNQYSFKSDVWSIGIVFYEMLVGSQSYLVAHYSDILNFLNSGQIFKTIPHVSQLGKQLLARMLTPDPNYRADTSQILELVKNYSKMQGARSRASYGPSIYTPLPATYAILI